MIYEKILNKENEEELDQHIEKSVQIEYRNLEYEGQKIRRGMTPKAWPKFLSLLEKEKATLSEIERIALVGMKAFPLRGYQSNFSEAVDIFYEHFLEKKE